MLRRGPIVLAALWLAAAVLATGVGLLAVQLVAGELGEPGTTALDGDAVGDALASVTPTRSPEPTGASASPSAVPAVSATSRPRPGTLPTTSPVATPRASSSPRAASMGPVRTVSTRGGSVSARCVGGEPRLVLVTPAEGYRIEESRATRVTFESSDYEVEVRLGCDGSNRVTAEVRTERRSDGPAPEPSRSEDD